MTPTRSRLLRAAATLVAAASLLASAPPALAATETPVSASAVGAAQLVLVESVHASGKVLRIGAGDAQVSSAPGSTTPAVASISSMAQADPQTLSAQALRLYPVVGSARTFLIADQKDRVLTRSRNDQDAFRYLQTADVADSATDPYAQWELRDAGNGAVNLVNVQRDREGRESALDLYNWKTADGSEVQTYTLNASAAVQQWRVHALTPTVTSPSLVTTPGVLPTLPSSLSGRYGWGRTVTLSPITWALPAATTWLTPGMVSVTGTAKGFFGEDVALTASVAVGALSDAADSALTTYAGATVAEVAMRAPATVQRRIGDTGQTLTAPVRWDFTGVTDAAFSTPGTVKVPAVSGLGFSATLVVTVSAAQQVNVLRQSGVHPDWSFKDSTTFALTDGNRTATGFADWRSGGSANRVNPNRVTFYLDQPRQISSVNVYDIGGKQNIGSVTVQYRTTRGGWANLPSATAWPAANTSADLRLEVTASRPVLATGLRVLVKNKTSSTWMTLSEIEAFGPQLTPAS
ncbi:RICIN domain-containing protein [Microbacterium testaceum]|uniref:RICIN domain-containing protein n=1 Tax=Microbacterium testaceum TaxID=2033 RepID=UPI0024350DBB|nr:hypothetical protein [Microbacterium testaceum]